MLQLLGLARPDRGGAHAPFSFDLAGEPGRKLIKDWQRTISQEGENVYDVKWRNPDESISLSATVNSFKQFPGIDYLVHIANHGKQNTPVFENILPLDITLDINEVEPINLYYAKGSSCAIDDFLPLETKIVRGKPIALEPDHGRSSCGILPFFNLAWKGRGLMIAIGWSGQWIFKIQRDIGGIRIQAGMAITHLPPPLG